MTRSSKDKLNAVHISGSIGLAAIVAAMCQSIPLFLLVAGALIGASVLTGEIRVPKRHAGKPRR